MTSRLTTLFLIGGAAGLAACAGPRAAAPDTFVMGQAGATARARADSARLPYTQADIDFMSGMIHHHAQAITISRWAPGHGASAAVQRLTARIINAQSDEISTMQQWLRDRNQDPMTVDSLGMVTIGKAGAAQHGGHDMSAMAGMPGMAAMPSMPGMLTEAQLKQLDAARGAEFDHLLLVFMMQHHRGAVSMVRSLFSNQGAGQDETVFKFASDVEVDQSTEIQRMLSMLLEMGYAPPK
ncbi:MAG: DUF305 domain-containing protein [Gemmatimonadaceae bacterium]|nr:DUF305 domain-containing protein [Gemmatimonadaceae bacterium]